jgi:hypothetical protein
MEKMRTLACAGALLGLTSAGSAAVLFGPVVDPANGHTYYALTPNSWTASEAEAVSMGGHLATIRNEAENEFVFSTFFNVGVPHDNIWIGLYDPNPAGPGTHASQFVWSSGEPVTFTRWGAGEPNNSGDEYWTVMQRSAFNVLLPRDWNDGRNDGEGVTTYGIVEVVPEPTATLGSVVTLTVGLRRRRRMSPANREAIA